MQMGGSLLRSLAYSLAATVLIDDFEEASLTGHNPSVDNDLGMSS